MSHTSPNEPSPEELQEEASFDEAVTRELAHEDRRDAEAKQSNIEKRTREHGLDQG